MFKDGTAAAGSGRVGICGSCLEARGRSAAGEANSVAIPSMLTSGKSKPAATIKHEGQEQK